MAALGAVIQDQPLLSAHCKESGQLAREGCCPLQIENFLCRPGAVKKPAPFTGRAPFSGSFRSLKFLSSWRRSRASGAGGYIRDQ